ncbi:MAG: DUF1015 family protein [Nitrospirales bacterium]|nr:DUF1015 family protein [Nitrospirales bacterium]
MALITPFRALRPRPEQAAQVAAPPYDVVSLEEARQQAEGNPHSFLRISRAELELQNGIDPYSPEVYEHGARKLQELIQGGILTREARPILGVYRQKWGTHMQTGLVALASVEEYDQGIIKKHELTRPVKENDRVQLIQTHESQSGPVLLFFRHTPAVDNWFEQVTNAKPDVQFVASDTVEHTVWSVREESRVQQIVEAFRTIPALYIADGHHRSAAASRVRAARQESAKSGAFKPEDGFLAVIFPHDQLQIFPYNRVVRDLHGHTSVQLLKAIGERFEVQSTSQPGHPPDLGFDMYVEGRWHRAKPKFSQSELDAIKNDPVRDLAVAVLTERVLDPLLGIKDQRSDVRIDFVGGVKGPEKLAAMVDRGEWAVAFWLSPTTVDQLMAVSDADQIMPPKSTWFEPKLRDGLFIHMLR